MCVCVWVCVCVKEGRKILYMCLQWFWFFFTRKPLAVYIYILFFSILFSFILFFVLSFFFWFLFRSFLFKKKKKKTKHTGLETSTRAIEHLRELSMRFLRINGFYKINLFQDNILPRKNFSLLRILLYSMCGKDSWISAPPSIFFLVYHFFLRDPPPRYLCGPPVFSRFDSRWFATYCIPQVSIVDRWPIVAVLE